MTSALRRAERTIAHSALALDGVRARLLRFTLSWEWVRYCFCKRWARLASLFALAMIGALFSALEFPLWVLVLGPVVYGVPHLFADIRYVPRAAGIRSESRLTQAISLLSIVFSIVIALRLSEALHWIALPSQFSANQLPEWIAAAVTVFGCAWILRAHPVRALLATAALAPLAWLVGWLPVGLTAAVLHNAVSFLYWIRATKQPAERRVALAATACFLAVNWLLLTGRFDAIAQMFSPNLDLAWSGVDLENIGRQMAPWSNNPAVWYRYFVTFAFGQSLHYFVWLKAIPDQYHSHDVPTTFRQSFGLLQRDFGRRLATLIPFLCIAGLAAWIVLAYPHARLLYFATTSFHTYLELGGLALGVVLSRCQA